jgi:hypothetical protein
LLQYVVPDVPYDVSEHIERQKLITEVLIEGAEEEPEILSQEERMSVQRQTYSDFQRFFEVKSIPHNMNMKFKDHLL